jgi:hypothetical protein
MRAYQVRRAAVVGSGTMGGGIAALLEIMHDFGERTLGKGIVVCKDTPNFVGNRVGIATIGFRMWYGLEHGYTIEEVDTIAGPHLGYPTTAAFRLMDLTGIDVMAHVERHFHAALPDELTWNRGRSAAVAENLVARQWLGNKTGVGFYKEARAMGYIRSGDRVVMNRDLLLGEAKAEARRLADSSFRPPVPEKIYAGGRDLLAAVHMMPFQMREGGQISEHDLVVARQLAWVLCGGDLSSPARVDEQYILDLERQACVFLIQQPKTQERIRHMLKIGQSLRNEEEL